RADQPLAGRRTGPLAARRSGLCVGGPARLWLDRVAPAPGNVRQPEEGLRDGDPGTRDRSLTRHGSSRPRPRCGPGRGMAAADRAPRTRCLAAAVASPLADDARLRPDTDLERTPSAALPDGRRALRPATPRAAGRGAPTIAALGAAHGLRHRAP